MLLLELFEAGAKHVFLVTGGGAMHLNDAFGRNKSLESVCFHHEQAAAMAAESYYRLTNRLAVLNVTTGPGGINALNGVYGAFVDSLGMLVISGQVKKDTYLNNYPIPLRQLGDQEVDIVSMARPIVKYATVLQDPLQVKNVMDKAIYFVNSGRPGPVWVDVPVDVQGALVDPELLKAFNSDLESLILDPDISENTKLELNSQIHRNFYLEIQEVNHDRTSFLGEYRKKNVYINYWDMFTMYISLKILFKKNNNHMYLFILEQVVISFIPQKIFKELLLWDKLKVNYNKIDLSD